MPKFKWALILQGCSYIFKFSIGIRETKLISTPIKNIQTSDKFYLSV